VSPKLLLAQQLQSFEINYLKEVSLNDTVAIEKHESDSTTTFTLTANDKLCCAVQLNFQ
jgi:hypothetical protein